MSPAFDGSGALVAASAVCYLTGMNASLQIATRQGADVAAVIARYRAGESVQAMAADLGVHRAMLYRWMLAEPGPEYEPPVTAMLVGRAARPH